MNEINKAIPPKRPELLTVICILTFVGASYGILTGVYKLATVDISKAATEIVDSVMQEMKEGVKNVQWDSSATPIVLPDSLLADSLSTEENALKDSLIRNQQRDWSRGKKEIAKGAEVFEEITDFTSALMHKTNAHVQELAACDIVGGLLCLCGALLMFRLRKIGFYAYITGQVIDWIIPIVILDVFSPGSLMGNLVAVFMVSSLLVPIGLIVLYAVNLKHMK